MNLYFAGDSYCWDVWQFLFSSLSSILQSYYYALESKHSAYRLERLIKLRKQKMNSNKINLFLDSGAFSAWSKGEQIDIDKYIEFIKNKQRYLSHYANLDVIGDSEQTWKNQKKMEAAGLNPMPCFHFGEDLKYLTNYYLIGKYAYIALGGMVGRNSKELVQWLDNLFSNYLCDKEGNPKIKVHGFGMTSFNIMFRYPWFSVDSTSWSICGRMGGIYVPRYEKEDWIYNSPPDKIFVSSQSPNKFNEGKHIETLSSNIRNHILNYIHSKGYKLGKTENKNVDKQYKLKKNEKWANKEKTKIEIVIEKGIGNDYKLRDEINILYFLDLEKSFSKWPWQFKMKKLGFGI